jgi:hypothetical protein
VNQRLYPVPFEVGTFIFALLVGMVLYIGSGFLAQGQEIYKAWEIYIGALALYSGFLMLLVKLPKWNRKRKS